MKRLVICLGLLAACTPASGVRVEPSESYFGAEIDGGGVITAIADTLKLRRYLGAPFTDQDFAAAFEAARATCAARGETIFGDGTDDLAGLPRFFDGEWEIAAQCRPAGDPL